MVDINIGWLNVNPSDKYRSFNYILLPVYATNYIVFVAFILKLI